MKEEIKKKQVGDPYLIMGIENNKNSHNSHDYNA